MKKALCLRNQVPEIERIAKDFEDFIKRCNERSQFLKNQHETLHKEYVAFKKEFGDELKDILKTKGLLPPEYDEKKGHSVEYTDSGVVYFLDEPERDPLSFLRDLIPG